MISGLGNGMTAFALGVFVYRQTQTATGFAMVVLCAFLPSILLKPFGGVWADRFDRRTMIIIGDLGSSAGVIYILATMLTGDLAPRHIYIGVTISSLFVALQNPAYKALITDLLTEDQYSRASGMVQLSSSAQHLLSPFLAGLLLSLGSITTIMIIDISSFMVAVVTVLCIRGGYRVAASALPGNLLRELKEGWHAVSSNAGVVLVVGLISLVTFFVGFLQTLFGPMVLSFANAKTLGFSQAVSASGMLVSSIIVGTVTIERRHARMLVAGLAMAGVCLSLMGMSTNIFFITGAFFMFFFALPLINTGADVLVRKNIPNESQGRAWGIIGVLTQLGFVFAYMVSGYLADHVFNPLLANGGALTHTVGRIIGTGPGRGIGLMLVISGACVAGVSVMASRMNQLHKLDAAPVSSIQEKEQ